MATPQISEASRSSAIGDTQHLSTSEQAVATSPTLSSSKEREITTAKDVLDIVSTAPFLSSLSKAELLNLKGVVDQAVGIDATSPLVERKKCEDAIELMVRVFPEEGLNVSNDDITVPMSKSTFARFKIGQWINDDAIRGAIISCGQELPPPVYLVDPHSYSSKTLKELSAGFTTFVCPFGGQMSHWILLVATLYPSFGNKLAEIKVYNSLETPEIERAGVRTIGTHIKRLTGNEDLTFNVIKVKCALQSNYDDCGIAVISNAIRIIWFGGKLDKSMGEDFCAARRKFHAEQCLKNGIKNFRRTEVGDPQRYNERYNASTNQIEIDLSDGDDEMSDGGVGFKGKKVAVHPGKLETTASSKTEPKIIARAVKLEKGGKSCKSGKNQSGRESNKSAEDDDSCESDGRGDEFFGKVVPYNKFGLLPGEHEIFDCSVSD
ncbi:hypothetical protein ONS95_004703 [Cadophora gregata]|uniref:uncharacterized protein n=1 Tax=Cadophora gregata TaxID=51156 RepID=UPI0026DAE9A0|nr:uncharacterized protein ONS95_004703 [Cadophora gregata]KAK0104409.1 hypothetical protein ONS95_004703 [Cadophora gregata]KAK0115495.1 hypothetical protein ONS96_013949 [Cadophora gregata f. sp. sojae]